MTATTYTHIPGAKSGKSFTAALGRFFWRIIEAQEKAAQVRIARHFQGMDDEYLKKLGYNPTDIARVRRG